jgi:hypothetical protein
MMLEEEEEEEEMIRFQSTPVRSAMAEIERIGCARRN